jgi:hypothetical protein
MIGDKLTLDEVLAIAEEVRGCKFQTAYDSLKALRSGRVTELPAHAAVCPYIPKERLQGMRAVFGRLFRGFLRFRAGESLNSQFRKIGTR